MFRRTKEPIRCPVGGEKIGERWIEQGCAAYCDDCDYTYYFKAYATVPYKNMEGKANAKSGCGCGRCEG